MFELQIGRRVILRNLDRYLNTLRNKLFSVKKSMDETHPRVDDRFFAGTRKYLTVEIFVGEEEHVRGNLQVLGVFAVENRHRQRVLEQLRIDVISTIYRQRL